MSRLHGTVPALAVVFALAASTPAFAERPEAPSAGDAISIGHTRPFESEILGETRQLELRLPTYYDEGTDRYPVLVVLDGGSYFEYMVSILEMMAPNHIPEMIVVGLPNTDRGRDLDPIDDSLGEAGAGTARFRRFLKDELFAYLEQKFRVQPHRVLAGHSLAGVYVLHTLLNEPELFQAYVASSPGLRSPERKAVIQTGLEGIDPTKSAGRFVFISAGGMESPEVVAGVEELGETLRNRQQLSLQAVWRVYPGEGHVPIKGFYEALRQHFADWFPPRRAFVELDWPAVEEHYEGLSRRFGFPVKAPYDIVGSVARRAAREGKTETALSAYRAMVAAYPEDDLAREKLAELGVLGSRGPYLGQKPPGMIPEPFANFLAPATDNKHSALAFSPDGKELYYSVYPNYQFPQKIMVTRQEDGGWTPPQVAEFSGTHQEGGPVFSPDGRRLYFYSRRPLPGSQEATKRPDAWYVEREAGVRWSEPRPVEAPINSEQADVVRGFSPSGDMLLTRIQEKKPYLFSSSPTEDGWAEPVRLKSEHYGDEFFDATDMGEGDFFIFDVNKKTYGPWYNAYLYISYRNPDGSWTAPKNMGDMINRGEGRFPSFSPDGRYLFFTSYRTGQAGYYWVDAKIIGYLRDHDLDLVAQLTQTVATEGVAAARRRWEQKRAELRGYYDFDHRLFDDVADELVQDKKREAAVEVLRLNQELYPDGGSLLRRIKLAALREDEGAFARLRAELAAGSEPEEDDLNRWGRFVTRCGYHRGAVLVFELTLELNPRSADAHVGLGAVHKEQGDLDAARASLETALKLDPDNARAKRLREEIEG